MIAPLLLSLTFALLPAQDPRPGLVPIPAGNVLLGADSEPTMDRIREQPVRADIFAGELPRQSVRVDSFLISPTPVTNEMYLEFVNATGAIPPPGWAVISKEKRQKLIRAGKEAVGPGYMFDEEAQARWWALHWQDEDQEWNLPPEAALEPVVFISFLDAQAYCEWTGLRLPTEVEWVRAARGDTSWDYPYAADFDRTKSSSVGTKPNGLAYKRLPVCTFENQSPFGVYDMVGQIHELTDSPWRKLEGFKSFKIDVTDASSNKETLHPGPAWDESRAVLKGGCFSQDSVFMRIDSRLGYEKSMGVKVVGFRVASSSLPFQDSAYLKTRDMRSGVLGAPPASGLDFPRTIGLEQFSIKDLSTIAAKRGEHKALVPLKITPKLPDSYAVFGAHRALTFSPRIDPFSDREWASFSKVDRDIAKSGHFVPIGALCTDVGFDGYDIAPGTYTMAYMPGLKKNVLERMGAWIKDREKPTGEEEIKNKIRTSIDISNLPFVATRRYVLLVDHDGLAVAAIPLTMAPINKKDSAVPHALTFDPKTEALQVQFKVSSNRGKAYGFTFQLKPVEEDGTSLADPASWK